ncbi:MAG: pyridoxal phosphate-dependent aminotransferase [Spirochaetales bacterium]|nr:pyridoxal phosphate-dependent aminotransferase [Spirochaetales bacterium]
MATDFDRIVERRGTDSLKWDFQERFTGLDPGADGPLLPLWVADMDFPAPEPVIEAVRRRAEHGVFGYTLEPDSYFEAIADWMRRRHGWQVPREWMLSCPGVVPTVSLAILAYTLPGDRVVLQPPVYFPFRSCVESNGRQVAENPLVLEKGSYRMDLEGLERLLDESTRLLVLCSPHNPVGRVWRPEELLQLVKICRRRGVTILSDEIHHDLVLKGSRHTPTASLSAEAARITVTLTSATKTFNLAGLGGSLAVAADSELRRRLEEVRDSLWTGLANAFSTVATEAAYRHGEPWLEALLRYLEGNYASLRGFLEERLPAARVTPLEGTYLAWVDLRPLGFADGELKERILRRARVWLDDGPIFGTGGEGFQRINLACPRATLEDALQRIANALAEPHPDP